MAINQPDKKALDAIALSIRCLAMDGVQKANSGHPGLPMGCAEIGALIFGAILKHHPADPQWPNRDRFVLSAGHGSMLLYSLLHLSGYELAFDELKKFRQLDSKTPGHPEYRDTPGVEMTTGPLGQGLATAVGMAMAERILAARLNRRNYNLIDYNIYVLASDGDMMEGVSSEAASLAGHLGLGKLIVFYDSNKITIEGSTDLAFSEDVRKRFEAFNWHTAEADAYDYTKILQLVAEAQSVTDRPSLIKLNSVMARGAATMQGSHEAHGAPLGEAEVKATKQALHLPEDTQFYIDPLAEKFFAGKRQDWGKTYQAWQNLFEQARQNEPELAKQWDAFFKEPGSAFKVSFDGFKTGDKVATRAASGKVLNAIAALRQNLVGGSADLAPSNKTLLNGMGDIGKGDFTGRNLHFGIREHAMGCILNGMALCGGLRPYGSTFLVFADYMRPAIRMASLMKLPVIYVFTHDSIYVGEDGPTHQPVEHVASLRIIPGLSVLRPADAQETALAWQMAISRTEGPTALILTRQNLEIFPKQDSAWMENIQKGAYIAKDSVQQAELVIIATGSEVTLALDACKELDNPPVRIVSMLSPGLFNKQSAAFREQLVPAGAKLLIIEAGVGLGWQGFAGRQCRVLSIDRFGKSGPAKAVAEQFGFSASSVAKHIRELLVP